MMAKEEDSRVPGASPFHREQGGQSPWQLLTGDRGATLMEIIIALLLTSLILGTLGTAIYQQAAAAKGPESKTEETKKSGEKVVDADYEEVK